MKLLICLMILFSTANLMAGDPVLDTPGPTPDAGNKDTSIMGGGTPGNKGERTLDQDVIQEQQDKKKKHEFGKEKEITDQNSTLDSI